MLDWLFLGFKRMEKTTTLKFLGKPKIPKYKHKTCMPKHSALSRGINLRAKP